MIKKITTKRVNEKSGKITRIEPQKHRRERYNIYINGDFGFGISRELVLKYNLHEGDMLDEEVIKRIILDEEKRRVKEKALSLLSYRARSTEELRRKLKDKGFSDAVVCDVVGDLRKIGVLDDIKFAASFVYSRMRQKPMSKRLLYSELISKGVDREISQRAVEEFFKEQTEEDVAKEIVKKKVYKYKEIDNRVRKRLSDFLARRGFDWDVINSVVSEIVDAGRER